MQMSLPLPGLAPLEPVWEGFDPDRRAEAVLILARLMAKVLNPQPEQEHNND
jgi:hypothetical protein